MMIKQHVLRILTLLRRPVAKPDKINTASAQRLDPRDYRAPIIGQRVGHRSEYKTRGY